MEALIDNVDGDSAHLQKLLVEPHFGFCAPVAKRVFVDLLDFDGPEIAGVVSSRKNLKTPAKSVGGQTLVTQLRF